ncbi:GNAT family N-acetyltransferase [Haemophilus parahaemolyticus]|uniref:GNAT family N-acetyltransferase n=1 Tax=Haemophilus parahaemolyticus TaxID=735 RepID=UPI002583FED6|nr:GNAT family N-acetyltransferase [Haemophilus parahaemolyticus]
MRKLVILTQIPSWLYDNFRRSVTTHRNNIIQEGIFLPHFSNTHTEYQFTLFTNAKGLLGSEHPFAFYFTGTDSLHFNLDAFAILAGTIEQQGCLYLICPDWNKIETVTDYNALRWNENHAIPCPTFFQHFKTLVEHFDFYVKNTLTLNDLPSAQNRTTFYKLTATNLTKEQQNIFQNLPLASEDIHLITAPRGRGKSTLAGKLAEQIAQEYGVVITARSRSALTNFWKISDEAQVTFFPPDTLLQKVKEQSISPHQWLFIDEAASLPLPFLHQFCHYFDKIVLTTTTHNYEGTGRGFSLKFLPQLHRKAKHWQLTEPLRWKVNDPLEAFVNTLLLLDENLSPALQNVRTNDLYYSSALMSLDEKKAFYTLLAKAHYKTTPTDLRRLFDGDNQQFFRVLHHHRLLGGIWAINEGGLKSELSQAIWRGERRPQGSLVAQYLCFQANLPEACELHSVRISRIAIAPQLQNQGIGKRLISEFILQIRQQKHPLVDFVSVSFGMAENLLHFWQQAGFELVQITPNKEASSGYPSAMILYPLTEQGKAFCEKAAQRFQADQAVILRKENADVTFSEEDLQNLNGFANHQRTLTACYASLKRLYLSDTLQFAELAEIFEQPIGYKYSKSQVAKWKETVQHKLFNANTCKTPYLVL